MKDYSLINIIRICIFHLSALFVFEVGYSHFAFIIFGISYFVRSFAISGGYHRYFSHRCFKTTRTFQFILALLGTSTGQKGPLSWATSHRKHHQYADTDKDPHSPVTKGWFHAHIGWLLKKNALPTDKLIEEEFKHYPEIILLNRFHFVGFIIYIASLYLLGHWSQTIFPALNTTPAQLVVWGGILSTLCILHATCLINSIGHRTNKHNTKTKDKSQNSLLLYPLTLGENWHHNHHKYAWSANTGISKGQIDIIFQIIKCLEKLGLVWEVKNAKHST